jgi:hypothetical protein
MLIKLINDFPSLVVMLVGTVIGLFCLIRGDFRGTLQFVLALPSGGKVSCFGFVSAQNIVFPCFQVALLLSLLIFCSHVLLLPY